MNLIFKLLVSLVFGSFCQVYADSIVPKELIEFFEPYIQNFPKLYQLPKGVEITMKNGDFVHLLLKRIQTHMPDSTEWFTRFNLVGSTGYIYQYLSQNFQVSNQPVFLESVSTSSFQLQDEYTNFFEFGLSTDQLEEKALEKMTEGQIGVLFTRVMVPSEHILNSRFSPYDSFGYVSLMIKYQDKVYVLNNIDGPKIQPLDQWESECHQVAEYTYHPLLSHMINEKEMYHEDESLSDLKLEYIQNLQVSLDQITAADTNRDFEAQNKILRDFGVEIESSISREKVKHFIENLRHAILRISYMPLNDFDEYYRGNWTHQVKTTFPIRHDFIGLRRFSVSE